MRRRAVKSGASQVRKDNFHCQYQIRDDQSLAFALYGIQMPLQYLSRHLTTPLTSRSLLESPPKRVLSQCCQANRTKVGGCKADPEFRPDRVVLAVCAEQKLQRRECFLFFDNDWLGSGSKQQVAQGQRNDKTRQYEANATWVGARTQ